MSSNDVVLLVVLTLTVLVALLEQERGRRQ